MVRRLLLFMPTLSSNKVYKAQIQMLFKHFVVKHDIDNWKRLTLKGNTALSKRHCKIIKFEVNALLKAKMIRLANFSGNFLINLSIYKDGFNIRNYIVFLILSERNQSIIISVFKKERSKLATRQKQTEFGTI